MRRRLLAVVCAVAVVALAATAVALARPGGSAPHRTPPARPLPGYAGLQGPAVQGVVGMVVDSLAARLNVTPAQLRKAVRDVTVAQRRAFLHNAGVTQADLARLRACGLHRRGVSPGQRAHHRRTSATCDPATAGAILDKLRTAAKPDLATLKSQLATALAGRLGTTPTAVLAALRAELQERLDQAAGLGLVTAKGETLALGCFDDPATCDRTALMGELHLGALGRHGAATGRGHLHRHHR